MRLVFFLLLALLMACIQPDRPVAAPKAVPADWVQLEGCRLSGQVRVAQQELRLAPFSPLGGKSRLLVYDYPQVRQLTLPQDHQPRDIAFFDISGRAIDVYARVFCPKGPCSPLKTRFAAASVLIAPAGTLAVCKFEKKGQMRWAKPSHNSSTSKTVPLGES